MKIITWATDNPDIAPSLRACARFRIPAMVGFGQTRRQGEDWHPIVIYAASEDEARAKAQAWWDAEVQKVRDKEAAAQARADARAASAAAKKAGMPIPEAETQPDPEETDYVL